MTVKSKTERAEVIRMIKHYFRHMARAHEEVASAARIAQELVDEVEREFVATNCIQRNKTVSYVTSPRDDATSGHDEVGS